MTFHLFSAWNIHVLVFVPFLFPSFCLFFLLHIVLIGRCYYSFSVLFNLFFEYWYWYIDTCLRFLFIPLFMIHNVCWCHLTDIKPFASSLSFWSFSAFLWVLSLSILRMTPSFSQSRLPRFLSLWRNFFWRLYFRKPLLVMWGVRLLLLSLTFACLIVLIFSITKYL